MIAHDIQCEIVKETCGNSFIGLVADGTTDVSGKEQFATCLRYTNATMEVECRFLGFYNSPSTTGETLAKILTDILNRLCIPLQKLVGFSFDTAANMSGIRKGVQAHLKDECPHCIYVPCFNHNLDLCHQELSRTVGTINETLDFVLWKCDTGDLCKSPPVVRVNVC
jgi:hypothetical protein